MKVLILTADYGSGHMIASKGLMDALLEKKIDHNLLDVVEIGGVVEKATSKAYELMTKKGHLAWRMLYPNKLTSATHIRSLYRLLYKDKFAEYIEYTDPDVIISTHFLTTIIALMYKVKHPGTKVYSVITDFTVHPLWIWEGTEKYFVATEKTKKEAVAHGADENRVLVSGIPLREAFWKLPHKQQVRKYLNLPKDKTIILISAGSYDSTPIEPILKHLKKYKFVYPIILAGRKIDAYNKYNKILRQDKINGAVYPFVDFVSSIMAASDIFITKAGGITVAEGLAVGLPMIFFKSMPGQEEGNAQILEKEGCAIHAHEEEKVINALEMLITEKNLLTKMQKNCKRICFNSSSHTIIKQLQKDA